MNFSSMKLINKLINELINIIYAKGWTAFRARLIGNKLLFGAFDATILLRGPKRNSNEKTRDAFATPASFTFFSSLDLKRKQI